MEKYSGIFIVFLRGFGADRPEWPCRDMKSPGRTTTGERENIGRVPPVAIVSSLTFLRQFSILCIFISIAVLPAGVWSSIESGRHPCFVPAQYPPFLCPTPSGQAYRSNWGVFSIPWRQATPYHWRRATDKNSLLPANPFGTTVYCDGAWARVERVLPGRGYIDKCSLLHPQRFSAFFTLSSAGVCRLFLSIV